MRVSIILPLSLLACESEKGVTIYNSDPSATITSHASGAELLEGSEYTFIGQVSDENHPSSELKVVWSSNTREICAQTTPEVDGSTTCSVALETGENQIISPESYLACQ